MMSSYPITIYPSNPLYDSVCEGGTGNLFNSGNDDPEECIKQSIINHCIKVTSNYEEPCITWSTEKTAMYICASFPDIPEAGCTSYGDRPELEITHINGEEAVANEDDDKFYVCDDDILTITITDFDAEKNLVYGWLYTSMDVANDYPSDYAVLNGDGTITVEVGNLLEGGNEWCQLASYDPANEGECWSEIGVTTWENADKTNTPILSTQKTVLGNANRYEVMNSSSYDSTVVFEFEFSDERLSGSQFMSEGIWYITVAYVNNAIQGLETSFYTSAKMDNRCPSDRANSFFEVPVTSTIVYMGLRQRVQIFADTYCSHVDPAMEMTTQYIEVQRLSDGYKWYPSMPNNQKFLLGGEARYNTAGCVGGGLTAWRGFHSGVYNNVSCTEEQLQSAFGEFARINLVNNHWSYCGDMYISMSAIPRTRAQVKAIIVDYMNTHPYHGNDDNPRDGAYVSLSTPIDLVCGSWFTSSVCYSPDPLGSYASRVWHYTSGGTHYDALLENLDTLLDNYAPYFINE